MSGLRLEDALQSCSSACGAAHVRGVVSDADALADALFALWSQAKGTRPAWAPCIARVYHWAREVVEALEEAVSLGPESEIACSFSFLASYSFLYVRALIEISLRDAILGAERAHDDEEAERLRSVSEMVGRLNWTITRAAAEPF
jgi:hypothetical protein